MMGAAPYWFACPTERRLRAASWNYRTRRQNYTVDPHVPKLTGRTKPNPSRRRGPRTSNIVREYECQTCGHVGWSKHIDLERFEVPQ